MENINFKIDDQLIPILIFPSNITKILEYENAADIISLFTFYYYTAIKQRKLYGIASNTYCTNKYIQQKLRLGIRKIQAAKKALIEMKLIEEERKGVAHKDGTKSTQYFITVKILSTYAFLNMFKNEHVNSETHTISKKDNTTNTDNYDNADLNETSKQEISSTPSQEVLPFAESNDNNNIKCKEGQLKLDGVSDSEHKKDVALVEGSTIEERLHKNIMKYKSNDKKDKAMDEYLLANNKQYPEKFMEYWNKYKVGKRKNTCIAFYNLDNEDQENAIKYIDTFASNMEQREPKFRTHSINYLKNRLWEELMEDNIDIKANDEFAKRMYELTRDEDAIYD